jgi:hypothetical protein
VSYPPEKMRESVRRYRARNLEKVRASNRDGKRRARAEKPEVLAEQHRRWRESDAGKSWLERTREHRNAYQRAYNASRREWRREIGRRSYAKKHGLPEPSRPSPDACELCNDPVSDKRRLALDHDHKTGAFRGWLCTSCNTGIGKLGDSIEGLMKAVAYLTNAKKES